jgi:hypothetical protein
MADGCDELLNSVVTFCLLARNWERHSFTLQRTVSQMTILHCSVQLDLNYVTLQALVAPFGGNRTA